MRLHGGGGIKGAKGRDSAKEKDILVADAERRESCDLVAEDKLLGREI